MALFKILIEGRNCLLHIEGATKRCGFFATRMVKAVDAQKATEIVSHLLRGELSGTILNAASDPPVLDVAELSQLSDADDAPAAGFTWYVEDEN